MLLFIELTHLTVYELMHVTVYRADACYCFQRCWNTVYITIYLRCSTAGGLQHCWRATTLLEGCSTAGGQQHCWRAAALLEGCSTAGGLQHCRWNAALLQPCCNSAADVVHQWGKQCGFISMRRPSIHVCTYVCKYIKQAVSLCVIAK